MAISTGKVVALIQAMGGGADPAAIEAAVQDWLDNHPEATTTVQDGSITEQKLATSIAQKLGLISSLSDEIDGVSDDLQSFAYSRKYLTRFDSGAYKWYYPLEIANGTVLELQTVDGSNYQNGSILPYTAYAGTQLGTILPKVNGNTARFTVNFDGVGCIRTGGDFTHGACDVYEIVDGFNAKDKISALEATANGEITNIKHIFGFEFGDLNSSGVFVDSVKRMATPTMQQYDFNVIIPKKTGVASCYVITFDDASGTNPHHYGIVNTNYDFMIPAGTYFKLIIYNASSTDAINGSKTDNPVYNSFRAYNQYESQRFVRSGSYKDTYLYNRNVRSVCHRGANRLAPENTLPAFIVARTMGFDCVEADIAYTHDNVPVILHDTTIDRTSNGTGNIADLDYSEIENLDFGSWFSPQYAGTKIPTLEEFLQLCRKIGLRARLDLNHNMTTEQITAVCKMVVRNGMMHNTEFIGYNVPVLEPIKAAIPTATLIYLVNSVTSATITSAQALKSDNNDVHLLTQTITEAVVNLCADALIPLEYWTAGTQDAITALDPYVSVVTCEGTFNNQSIEAGYVLYNSVINN